MDQHEGRGVADLCAGGYEYAAFCFIFGKTCVVFVRSKVLDPTGLDVQHQAFGGLRAEFQSDCVHVNSKKNENTGN